MFLTLFLLHRPRETGRNFAAEMPVVKRAPLARENKGFAKALHHHPRFSCEMVKQNVHGAEPLSRKVIVDKGLHRRGDERNGRCFTTSDLALVKANWNSNPLRCKELSSLVADGEKNRW